MKARHHDWLGKTLAGGLLGFTLAMAIAGLVAWLGPGGVQASNKFQFVMWLVSPLWVAVVSLVYLFPSGPSAWLWLGLANVAAYAGLYLGHPFIP